MGEMNVSLFGKYSTPKRDYLQKNIHFGGFITHNIPRKYHIRTDMDLETAVFGSCQYYVCFHVIIS